MQSTCVGIAQHLAELRSIVRHLATKRSIVQHCITWCFSLFPPAIRPPAEPNEEWADLPPLRNPKASPAGSIPARSATSIYNKATLLKRSFSGSPWK